MIYDCKIVNGYPVEDPKLSPIFKERVLSFKPEINVLYSQIGTGKSSLLEVLKSYTCIPNSGWTKLLDPNTTGAAAVGHFPYVLRKLTTTGDIDAIIKWDGVPCFYNHSENRAHAFDVVYDDDITNEDERLENTLENYSSGQYIVRRINKILNVVNEGPPDYSKQNPNKEQKIQLKWMQQLGKENPKNKVPTLLLDEPEKGLSLPKQEQMWDVLTSFQNRSNVQMIIASHSLAVTGRNDVNFIELENGYLADVRKLITNLAQNINDL